MTSRERFAYLAARSANQSATAEELDELCELVKTASADELDNLFPGAPPVAYDAAHWDNIASRILAADKQTQRNNILPMHAKRRWLWAAAGVALLITAGGYFLLHRPAPAVIPTVSKHQQPTDIAPGGNKAILVLGDGSQIGLDSAANGALGQQGNSQVVKLSNGQLAYQNAGQSSANPVYNTIITPRGGKYQVLLPDGSKVWLNAASSLRYPTTFAGSRQVELTGEAYFEVAPDAGKPFLVRSNTQTVEVLGTAFNMMAYDDEADIRTTLLSGAVKVNGQKLIPGQCAIIDRSSGQLSVAREVNTEAVIAWKNGYIQFEGNDIRSAMRQICRWYNVDVEYHGEVPSHFRGTIPNDVPVSKVLEMMEMTGEVNFEISGRKIIVTPAR